MNPLVNLCAFDVTELLKKGIRFISLSDNLDFNTASGKLHFQILSAFAEFERELIRERTVEGLKRARTQGKILGRLFITIICIFTPDN